MGQVALGVRSLLIKLAVFFAMAAALAWALGGTLWPRAEVVDLDAVSFDGRECFWRLAIGGGERGAIRWTLMTRGSDGQVSREDGLTWVEVAGPVATPEALYYAGRASNNAEEWWHLERLPSGAAAEAPPLMLPDRLAVERQLARVKAGLPLEDAAAVRRHRPAVLDPPDPAPAPPKSAQNP